MKSFKSALYNSLYFLIVFLVACGIASQALARKVNTYEVTKKPLFLTIEKERVMISNKVTGRIESVVVNTGQHVHKGDLLVKLADESLSEKQSLLESLADENLSAKTELALLKAQEADYEIVAPRDGVVYQIQAAEGSYLSMNTPVITLFADSNVKVTGMINQEQYASIQKNKDIDVYSPRFEQIYQIGFEGIGRVEQSITEEESKYEVKFRFDDASEGAAFVDGESLEVITQTNDSDAVRPSERITRLWNTLIVGK